MCMEKNIANDCTTMLNDFQKLSGKHQCWMRNENDMSVIMKKKQRTKRIKYRDYSDKLCWIWLKESEII